MSIQPSEFLKPCFAVVAAWLLSEGKPHAALPRHADRASAIFGVILHAAEVAARYRHAGGDHRGVLGQFYVSGLNLFLVGVGARA